MAYLRDRMDDSQASVRMRLFDDEDVLAIGRCADITTTGDLDSAGAGWSFVMVTERRVHWVPSIRSSIQPCSLDLDRVRRCAEIHWRHRSAIAMDHDPLVRPHFAPNGRKRNWDYASVDVVMGPLSRTILGFSRSTTNAARALKEQLAVRGIPTRPVERQSRLP
jgi:hypothetical protein